MARHRVTTITLLVGPDKVSPATRYDRGVVVASRAPSSAFYLQNADFKAAADALVQENAALKTLIDASTNAEADVGLTRTRLALAITNWDSAYNVYVSAGEKYAATPADAHQLGCVPKPLVWNPVVPPLSVTPTYDPVKDLLRVRVRRAPGPLGVEIQVSPDPVTASSWIVLPGLGALQSFAHPAKGTWWVRAQTVGGSQKSDFTVSVACIVR